MVIKHSEHPDWDDSGEQDDAPYEHDEDTLPPLDWDDPAPREWWEGQDEEY